jgi:hypothetical protein
MKFSYTWLAEMVDGLDTPPKDLERLITLRTAECEGVEEVGAYLAGASEALVISVEPIGTGHNRKAVIETRGINYSPRSSGQEDNRRRGERRHAGERRRAGDQPGSRGNR